MKRTGVVIIVAAIGLLLRSTSARSCSCEMDQSPKFLVPSGVTFPSNFRGVPCVNLKDVSKDRVQIIRVGEDFFERIAARESVMVDAEIESPPLPEEYAGTHNPWQRGTSGEGDAGRVSLICAAWEPGGTYRVRLPQQEIIIHVAKRAMEIDQHKIGIWQNERSAVLTSSAGGSCSTVFTGHRVGVELTGEAVDQWRDALLYLTVVDRQMVWRPEYDICTEVPPGMSWVGSARELLYGRCGTEAPSRTGVTTMIRPLWNLERGNHEVTMIAWLPGVMEFSATTTVVIDCK
jgi:hypothetical protein